ncbi:hypothetical protein RSK20926_17922 [Roseobacter sp. SK209-2-6]|nr:hypothetical protein RSK20926_17922 [Roseobacter sp. SK209-2-6]
MHLPCANLLLPSPGGRACKGECLVRAIWDGAQQETALELTSGPRACMLFALARVIAFLLRQAGFIQALPFFPLRGSICCVPAEQSQEALNCSAKSGANRSATAFSDLAGQKHVAAKLISRGAEL